MTTKSVTIGDVTIGGGHPLVFIAGPCVIESEKSALRHAARLKKIADTYGVGLIFKSSYDKANRTSIRSFRGPGMASGLSVLKKVRQEFDLPVLTDVHSVAEVKAAARVADCLQIPAFLSRQTDLLVAAAKTKKAVNIKKGQFLAPWNMVETVKKVEACGNQRILLTERGASFGYNQLVVDFRSLGVMRQTGYPVVFDATHSVQLPGGRGDASGGERRYVTALARAAVAFGCDALFMEVHEDPDSAPCDGPNMISLDDFEKFVPVAMELDRLALKNKVR
jgi:2-dehydro-3-deoxyphosphooctonate aldolase (KDO 8-P synthase)